MIKKLDKSASIPPPKSASSKSTKFAGKSFVFTGGLANRSREEAAELVQQHGGKISGSVSKKTSYVVVGTDPAPNTTKPKTSASPSSPNPNSKNSSTQSNKRFSNSSGAHVNLTSPQIKSLRIVTP